MPTRKPTRAAAGSPARPRVALVLQGGGALGAYHLGAYQALHEAGLEPDWVAGISIGAVNACVIAGNEPGERLGRLLALWEEISRPGEIATWLRGPWRVAANRISFAQAVWLGQPNFWTPRIPSPFGATDLPPEQASWYDTAPLLQTLPRFADFDRINAGTTRLTLGATCITRGELEFFDSRRREHGPIGPRHVLASGALPPGFPPTRVGRDLYWDGGCVSNTPLDAIYRDPDPGHWLVFMVDLWDAQGTAPTSMDAVAWRQKQIQYASRSAHDIRRLADAHNQRCALQLLARGDAVAAARCRQAGLAVPAATPDTRASFDIVQVIHHPGDDQIPESDAEFSRPSIAERRAAGLADMQHALRETGLARGRSAATPRAATPLAGTRVHTVRPITSVAAAALA